MKKEDNPKPGKVEQVRKKKKEKKERNTAQMKEQDRKSQDQITKM